jgi:hypothetical protein
MNHLKWLTRGAIGASCLALGALSFPSMVGIQMYIYPRDDSGHLLYDPQGHVLRHPNPDWVEVQNSSYEWCLVFLSIALICLLVGKFAGKRRQRIQRR